MPCAHGWLVRSVARDGSEPAEGSVRVQNEVGCYDMRKKVIPFPPRKVDSAPPVPPGRSRIVIHVGAQRYAIDIHCEVLVLPPEAVPAATPAGVEELQVQTRFLRLYKPAALGDHIDGWRVCWVGGVGRGVPVIRRIWPGLAANLKISATT